MEFAGLREQLQDGVIEDGAAIVALGHDVFVASSFQAGATCAFRASTASTDDFSALFLGASSLTCLNEPKFIINKQTIVGVMPGHPFIFGATVDLDTVTLDLAPVSESVQKWASETCPHRVVQVGATRNWLVQSYDTTSSLVQFHRSKSVSSGAGASAMREDDDNDETSQPTSPFVEGRDVFVTSPHLFMESDTTDTGKVAASLVTPPGRPFEGNAGASAVVTLDWAWSPRGRNPCKASAEPAPAPPSSRQLDTSTEPASAVVAACFAPYPRKTNSVAVLESDGTLVVLLERFHRPKPPIIITDFVPGLRTPRHKRARAELVMLADSLGASVVAALWGNELRAVSVPSSKDSVTIQCCCSCEPRKCQMALLAADATRKRLLVAGGNCVLAFPLGQLFEAPSPKPLLLWKDPQLRGMLAYGDDASMAVGRKHIAVPFRDGTVLVL